MWRYRSLAPVTFMELPLILPPNPLSPLIMWATMNEAIPARTLLLNQISGFLIDGRFVAVAHPLDVPHAHGYSSKLGLIAFRIGGKKNSSLSSRLQRSISLSGIGALQLSQHLRSLLLSSQSLMCCFSGQG